MKQVLITGNKGFIGRNFERHLERNGWDTRVVDAGPYDAFELFRQTETRFDLVIHAAAAGPNRRSIDLATSFFPYNTWLDSAMLHWAIRTRQRHVVYFSSSAIYADMHRTPRFKEEDGWFGRPFDRYGAAKRHGELMAEAARECGVDVVVVRPFSGYGTDQSTDFPFGAFLDRARRKEDPFTVWGSADQSRDFVHVEDIVNAVMVLVDSKVGVPVNICTGRATTMRELATMLADAHGYIPTIVEDKSAPMGVQDRIGDNRLLKGWYEPKITLEEGVSRAARGKL